MPPKSVSDEAVLEGLTRLFRRCGFEAASLSDIAEATGLQKSSLYHRFPDGKQQMALEVVSSVASTFTNDILAPLRRDAAPIDQVREVGDRLVRFYERGRAACLLDALSVDATGSVATALKATAVAWVNAFASVARRAGCGAADARRRAQDAIAAVEGGLVLSRVTGDNGAFLRAVERLPVTLGLSAISPA